MSALEQALRLAVNAHAGQTDKGGEPYILHPLRLMLQQTSPAARLVALLHDAIEDSPLSLDDLAAAGIPVEAITAIDCLTKRDGEVYADYLQRVAANPLARQVKLADLRDNMDITRLPALGEAELQRLRKYQEAYRYLLAFEVRP